MRQDFLCEMVILWKILLKYALFMENFAVTIDAFFKGTIYMLSPSKVYNMPSRRLFIRYMRLMFALFAKK